MNNSSMFTADRMTHFKFAVFAVICAPWASFIGVAARISDGTSAGRMETAVIKVAPPITAAAPGQTSIR